MPGLPNAHYYRWLSLAYTIWSLDEMHILPCMYVQRTDRDLFESGTSIKFSWWKWRLRWDLYYTLSGLGYAFPYTYILFSNLCFHFFEDLGIPWILDSVLEFLLCVIIGIKSLIQWKLLNIFCSKIVLPLENEEF